MLELTLVVGFVVITSGACSLFEAVLYSVPLSKIAALEQASKPSGPLLRTLRTQVDRPIAAILSLNTIANTGGAALAGAIASSVLGSVWIGYFSAAFTLIILLVSEIIPKTIGVMYASHLAGSIARPLTMLVRFCRPIIWVSRLVTQLVAANRESDHVTDEELLLMVRRGLSTGDLQPHEADVISNVLALETKSAAQIMTPRTVLFTLQANIPLAKAAADDHLLQHSRIPIYEDNPDDIIGVVHRRDILRAAAKDQFTTSLDDLMHPVHFVAETVKLDQLLRTFLGQRQHLIVVTDEFSSVAGIVTLEDVLEEILGREIIDEFDQVVDLRAFARQQRKSDAADHQLEKPQAKGQ
ncbi:MAG: hemolysin family protein [Acidobacteriota bacterium]|nr:hemolysin family protein [Acidobacteriota bacterium]